MKAYDKAEEILDHATAFAIGLPDMVGMKDPSGILVLGTGLFLALDTWMKIFDPGIDPRSRTLGDIENFLKTATAHYAVAAAKREEAQSN